MDKVMLMGDEVTNKLKNVTYSKDFMPTPESYQMATAFARGDVNLYQVI